MREIGNIKSMISDKEKEERKKNIVTQKITGKKELKIIKEDPQRWTKFIIKTKIGLDCSIEHSRVSNRVIVIKLSSEEKKGSNEEQK